MRRIAAHYIYCSRMYRMHYLEVDDRDCLQGIYPLEEEIAGTAFYGGILIPVPINEKYLSAEAFVYSLEHNPALGKGGKESVFEVLAESRITEDIIPGTPVRLFLFHDISLTPPEFGTDNRCGNGHIQRL